MTLGQASRVSRTPSPSGFIHPQQQFNDYPIAERGAPRLPPKEPSYNRTRKDGDVGSSSSSDNNTRSRVSSYNNNNNNYLSLPPSTSSFSNNLSKYATGEKHLGEEDLARAVRESVQIRSPSPNLNPSGLAPPLIDSSSSSSFNPSGGARRSPSPRMPSNPIPARGILSHPPSSATQTQTFQPGHGYSQSSPDMASIAQPRMGSNPFDEILEGKVTSAPSTGQGKQRSPEGAGVVQPSRQKFGRAMTATTPTSASQTPLLATSPEAAAPKTRVRRSLSTDSYGVESAPIRELTAGQKKAAADKKGSKHADIIDRWDPTGLGDAMWHHAGPYDAAAPSRNVNPQQAPMKVFTSNANTAAAAAAKKKSIPEDEPAASLPRSNSGLPNSAGIAGGTRQPANNRRVSGGGLTGQYSTSVPSGGGYFPDVSQPQDEATLARLERQKEREQKRRALKAAWGIDEPEPWEDFGVSPNEGVVDLGSDGLTSDTGLAKPLRSPGMRIGMPKSSPAKDGLPSPPADGVISNADLPGSGAAGRPGVKRTKSLMQKLKTMRENKSGIPFRSASPSKNVVLPASPSTEYPLPSPSDREEILAPNPFASPPPKTRTVNLVQPRTGSGDQYDDAPEDAEVNGDRPGFGRSETEKEFVFVDSPNSKVRSHTKKGSTSPTDSGIPPVPALPASISYRGGLSSGVGRNTTTGKTDTFRPLDRVKHLPPPPVGQVMPDFDDLVSSRRGTPTPTSEVPPQSVGNGEPEAGPGMRRKGSVVKKIRDRIK